jgi:hypothetical protein
MDANGLGLKNRSSWIKNENKWTPLWLSDGDRIVFRINGYQGNQLEGGIYTIGSDNKAPKLLFGGNVEKAYLIP